jgi:hypothetical protein
MFHILKLYKKLILKLFGFILWNFMRNIINPLKLHAKYFLYVNWLTQSDWLSLICLNFMVLPFETHEKFMRNIINPLKLHAKYFLINIVKLHAKYFLTFVWVLCAKFYISVPHTWSFRDFAIEYSQYLGLLVIGPVWALCAIIVTNYNWGNFHIQHVVNMSVSAYLMGSQSHLTFLRKPL